MTMEERLLAKIANRERENQELKAENHLLKAQVKVLGTNQEFLEDCLIEVGQVVYA